MTRAEQRVQSEQRELDKLNKQLERAEATYEKKLAIAQKYGVDTWDNEAHNKWLETVETNMGWIVNKDDIKINTAWWDLSSAKDRIDELHGYIEKAYKRLGRAQDEYAQEVEKMATEQATTDKAELMDSYTTMNITHYTKEEIEAMQQRMKEEWAKDGITITKFWGDGLEGITPSGKSFIFYINNGVTERSWHCYTLNIDGYTLFTSGTVSNCYRTIKNH